MYKNRIKEKLDERNGKSMKYGIPGLFMVGDSKHFSKHIKKFKGKHRRRSK